MTNWLQNTFLNVFSQLQYRICSRISLCNLDFLCEPFTLRKDILVQFSVKSPRWTMKIICSIHKESIDTTKSHESIHATWWLHITWEYIHESVCAGHWVGVFGCNASWWTDVSCGNRQQVVKKHNWGPKGHLMTKFEAKKFFLSFFFLCAPLQLRTNLSDDKLN